MSLELVVKSEKIAGMVVQFMGIYLLLSGVMSFIWGFTQRRKLGLWIVAGILGLSGGRALILKPTFESSLSTNLLYTFVGIIMLLIGLIRILGGFRLSEVMGRRWANSHIFLGVVEIALGALALVSLFATVEILRPLLSFWGIIAGTGLLLDGHRMRRAARQNKGSA